MTDIDLLDLDSAAAEREQTAASVAIRFRGEVFTLPAELPLRALSPLKLLDGKLGLLVYSDNPTALLTELASTNPRLVTETAGAFDRAARVLFGEKSEELLLLGEDPQPNDVPVGDGRWRRVHDVGQWPAFMAHEPSVQDLVQLGRGLLARYRVSLGDLFGSAASVASAGPTLSATSSGTTASTRAGRSGGRATRGS